MSLELEIENQKSLLDESHTTTSLTYRKVFKHLESHTEILSLLPETDHWISNGINTRQDFNSIENFFNLPRPYRGFALQIMHKSSFIAPSLLGKSLNSSWQRYLWGQQMQKLSDPRLKSV